MATTTCHPVHLHCLLIQYLKNSAPFLKLSTSHWCVGRNSKGGLNVFRWRGDSLNFGH